MKRKQECVGATFASKCCCKYIMSEILFMNSKISISMYACMLQTGKKLVKSTCSAINWVEIIQNQELACNALTISKRNDL